MRLDCRQRSQLQVARVADDRWAHSEAPLLAKVNAVQHNEIEERLQDLDLQVALGRLALSRQELERIQRHGLSGGREGQQVHLGRTQENDVPCQASSTDRGR